MDSLWTKLSDGQRMVLIAGPCVAESADLCLQIATTLKEICLRFSLDVKLVFKASFDKANRTSGESARGPGLAHGLAYLHQVKSETGLPVLTDVHETSQVDVVASVVDVIQIPAMLCRQTDLIAKAAQSGKILNIKKGQFLSPKDASQIVDKAKAEGCERVMLTERGTTFGYNNLVVDMRGLQQMKHANNLPVILDATHSTQFPGGNGNSSGGQSEFAPILARAGIAAGADGIFMEVHPEPSKSPSDGAAMIRLSDVPNILEWLVEIWKVNKRFTKSGKTLH